MSVPFRNRLLTVLYLAFVLTGAVTSALGPLIPFFLRRCAMSDADAGMLIAAQFTGSFVGAFIANRNLARSVLVGLPLIALGVGGLALVPCRLDSLCVAGYGLGLGLTISSINLIVARYTSTRRSYSLSLLNFLWGCGAVVSPVLIGWAQRHNLVYVALMTLAVAALGLWGAILAHRRQFVAETPSGSAPSSWYSPSLLLFATLLFLYVGIETSVANWSAPYALRMQNAGDVVGVFAAGLFWLTLLVGRVVCALVLRYAREALVYAASLALTTAGIILLLASRSGQQVMAAASITGLGLAPLFPLLVSFSAGALLASRNSGWVFSAAALGGAVVPWLTGRISTSLHSLRAGFLVPACAVFLFAALSLARKEGLRAVPLE